MFWWIFWIVVGTIAVAVAVSAWFLKRRREERKMLPQTMLQHKEIREFFEHFVPRQQREGPKEKGS